MKKYLFWEHCLLSLQITSLPPLQIYVGFLQGPPPSSLLERRAPAGCGGAVLVSRGEPAGWSLFPLGATAGKGSGHPWAVLEQLGWKNKWMTGCKELFPVRRPFLWCLLMFLWSEAGPRNGTLVYSHNSMEKLLLQKKCVIPWKGAVTRNLPRIWTEDLLKSALGSWWWGALKAAGGRPRGLGLSPLPLTMFSGCLSRRVWGEGVSTYHMPFLSSGLDESRGLLAAALGICLCTSFVSVGFGVHTCWGSLVLPG